MVGVGFSIESGTGTSSESKILVHGGASACMPSVCDVDPSHVTMRVENQAFGDESLDGASSANSCFSRDGVFKTTFDRFSPA